MKKKATLKLLFFCVLLVLTAVVFIRYRQYFTLRYVQSQLSYFKTLASAEPGKFIFYYFLVYVVSTAISIPGATVLTLLGGALFGTVTGTVIVSFASVAGATISFLLGRFLFRDYLEKKFSQQFLKINSGVRKEGVSYLFALRLVPIFPFFMVNLLMGLTRISTIQYMLVSQIGMLPGTIVYVYVGRTLATIQSMSDIMQVQTWIVFALIACLPLVSKSIVKFFRSRQLYKKFPKPESFDANIIVIGAGSGGLVASYVAARLRAKPILIEKAEMGGDCLNRGCVPSKALLSLSKLAVTYREAEKTGIQYTAPRISFKQVMSAVEEAIKNVAPHDSVERYSKLGVKCVRGRAELLSPWEARVGRRSFTARNIILATGASPRTLTVPGASAIPQYSSDTIWGLKKLPENLLVVGGGPIGTELSLAFARLGSKVHLVQKHAQLLPKEDDEVGSIAGEILRSNKVELITNASPVEFFTRNKKNTAKIAVKNEKTRSIAFSHLLVAIGRKVDMRELNKGDLDFEYNDDGTLHTNKHLQTRYPNIFAVGDLAAPYQFTHIAGHMGWIATANALFGAIKKSAIDYSNVPAVTYLSPEIARVGLNEKEAIAQSIPYECSFYDMKESDRAIAERKTQGFIKILTKPGKDKILGATVVAERGGEILGELLLAKKHGIGLNKILGTIHPYPTFAEAVKATAGVWKRVHLPLKIVRIFEKHFARKVKKKGSSSA